MSDTVSESGGTQGASQPSGSANAAQEAFGRYKARMAAPMAVPMMPGWGMPPSMAPLPGYFYGGTGPDRPHPMGSLTERLGATVRLGMDLLNAALSSGVSALSGGYPAAAGYHPVGHGCGCDCCGYDCCEVTSCGCCRPGVHGCGCCC
jgi:hypothetical protein